MIQTNPTYGNKKPSYRRFYLIHHLACAGEIKHFERFQNIPDFTFDLNLRVDGKKVNTIARENHCAPFAEYIEGKYPHEFQADQIDDQLYQPSETARQHTNQVNGLMDQRNLPQSFELSLAPAANHFTRAEADKYLGPQLTKQQQEKSKAASAKQPIDQIRILLTCSLTGAIVKDLVVAADGLTYERSAIEAWLEHHDHSPVTNETLPHKNLNPNLLVKNLLAMISP